jgi:hypothetical protein
LAHQFIKHAKTGRSGLLVNLQDLCYGFLSGLAKNGSKDSFRTESFKKKENRSMSEKHPECPLYNPLNCKEYYNPKLCAFVKKDKVCLKKKKPKAKQKAKV